MKKYKIHIILIFVALSSVNCYATNDLKTSKINQIINQLIKETKQVNNAYNEKNALLYTELNLVNSQLKHTRVVNRLVMLMLKRDELKETIEINNLTEKTDISKIRYLKGLQIIKILYEKTLTLDHHFTSVTTFNEINNLSNPNHYPEFIKLKDVIQDKKNSKTGFRLSGLLGDNIYTSVMHSIVSLFTNSNTSREEKEENIKNVECILDFTLRMHNDLNTIYFETAFLQKSNDNIIRELEQLFIDFTKPIKYKMAIKDCRNNDDWDTVIDLLNSYLKELNKAINDDSKKYKVHKMQINLEFPIERLLQFITQYNSHIDQGAKFYEKFGIMLDSYENESKCTSKIPIGYSKLKENINTSIEKFNTAYKPVEINGSKMKQVLYGINEYD